jgi:hypothetical protein
MYAQKVLCAYNLKDFQMKTIATLIAGLFAVTAFAAEPAKEMPKAAVVPAAAPAKVDAVTKQDKHDVAKPAKSEAAPAAKADAKAATPAAAAK